MKIHLQHLIGSAVQDTEGVRVGRVEAVHAHRTSDACLIDEYHLGSAAWLERIGISALRLIGWPSRKEPLRVPWQQLDISDPNHPKLRCTKAELLSLQPS